MKVRICHFREPIPVCGAWSPRSINLKAKGDLGYVSAMHADYDRRVIVIKIDGHRAPHDMKGEAFIPFELCRLIVPDLEPVVVATTTKKGEKTVQA